MPENKNEIEVLKKEVADIATFVKERVEPAREERIRLREAIDGLITEQREFRRNSLLGYAASDHDAMRVESGPYTGCDALDLGIARSIQRAAASRNSSEAVREWDIRIKAAMDSVTAGRGDELVATSMATRLLEPATFGL